MTDLPPMDDRTLDYWRQHVANDLPHGRCRMTNLALASLIRRIDEAVAKERERCALIIERHAEGSSGDRRVLVPRHDGNIAGLGYAHAIRATSTTEDAP